MSSQKTKKGVTLCEVCGRKAIGKTYSIKHKKHFDTCVGCDDMIVNMNRDHEESDEEADKNNT